MSKSTLTTVAVTVFLTILLYDKIAALPLVNKIPRV